MKTAVWLDSWMNSSISAESRAARFTSLLKKSTSPNSYGSSNRPQVGTHQKQLFSLDQHNGTSRR